MEKKKFVWPITICLSGKCDRNCRHCMFDANMNGSCLKLEHAMALAEMFKREIWLSRKNDLRVRLEFTGNGEPLLNPELVEIFDVLFGINDKVSGVLITSGVNPKNPDEAARLKKILSRDYASRIKFSLSFNRFEKRFPKRLIKTLTLLFENGVKEADIKICQPCKKTLETAGRLNDLLYAYFIRWVREINPLGGRGMFYETDISNKLECMVEDILYSYSGYRPRHTGEPGDNGSGEIEAPAPANRLDDRMRPLSAQEFINDQVYFISAYPSAFAFPSRYGTLKIRYQPHFLTKVGRAVALEDPGFPPDKHKRLCPFLANKEQTRLFISADGYYYPEAAGCTASPFHKLGHISEGFTRAYEYSRRLRETLLHKILTDNRPYEDLCRFCSQIAAECHFGRNGIPFLSQSA